MTNDVRHMGQVRAVPTIPFEEFARRLRVVFDDVARSGSAVLVEREGVLYRLERQVRRAGAPAPPVGRKAGAIWKGYDADQVLQAIREAAGALAGVDRDTLLEDLQAQRAQASRGRHD